ncbi:hypothetical protein [Roseovarius indicus]|uniref:hypothetical protein n=1 Tax=Roseovarius indicus TaxID=540747 RepID=UPI00405A1187
MRALALISLFVLVGCATPDAPIQRLPVQAATCPDPEDRAKLGDGSTFRDLAASRAEALTGWEECFTAAAENAAAIGAGE